MPLYEYECDGCGRRFELIRKFSDPAIEVCELCGKGPVRRLQSAPAIQFKGSGFYITDYARQDGDKGKSDKAAADKSKDAKSDAAAGDTGGSSETKAETTKSDGATKSDPPPKPATSAPAPSAPSTKD